MSQEKPSFIGIDLSSHEEPKPPALPKPPSKLKKILGKIKKALGRAANDAGEAAGEAFVNR